MRCADITCLHSEAEHSQRDSQPCRVCPCQEFRWVTPRHQQLQQEFGRMLKAGMRNILLTAIPDPTAEKVQEKKRRRGMEIYRL